MGVLENVCVPLYSLGSVVIAAWMTVAGVRTLLVDEKASPPAYGHADGIESRTFEILDTFGLGNAIWVEANPTIEISLWVKFNILTEKSSNAKSLTLSILQIEQVEQRVTSAGIYTPEFYTQIIVLLFRSNFIARQSSRPRTGFHCKTELRGSTLEV